MISDYKIASPPTLPTNSSLKPPTIRSPFSGSLTLIGSKSDFDSDLIHLSYFAFSDQKIVNPPTFPTNSSPKAPPICSSSSNKTSHILPLISHISYNSNNSDPFEVFNSDSFKISYSTLYRISNIAAFMEGEWSNLCGDVLVFIQFRLHKYHIFRLQALWSQFSGSVSKIILDIASKIYFESWQTWDPTYLSSFMWDISCAHPNILKCSNATSFPNQTSCKIFIPNRTGGILFMK